MLPCSRDALVGLAWRVAQGRGEGEHPTSRRLFLLGTRFSTNPVLLLDRGRQHKKNSDRSRGADEIGGTAGFSRGQTLQPLDFLLILAVCSCVAFICKPPVVFCGLGVAVLCPHAVHLKNSKGKYLRMLMNFGKPMSKNSCVLL
jgi:hypothetical protein